MADRESVKRILSAFDHRRDDIDDVQLRSSIEAMAGDEHLQAWNAEEVAFDDRMRSALKEAIPVPQGLKDRILAACAEHVADTTDSSVPFRSGDPEDSQGQEEVPRGSWWLHTSLFAAAAIIVMGLTLFATFGNRSFGQINDPNLKSALVQLEAFSGSPREMHIPRSYDDLKAYIQTASAPFPSRVSGNLPVEGSFACTVVDINGNKVSMVCFDVGGSTYHLFTLRREDFPNQRDIPRAAIGTLGEHCCATWTNEDQIHILTARAPEEAFRRLL